MCGLVMTPVLGLSTPASSAASPAIRHSAVTRVSPDFLPEPGAGPDGCPRPKTPASRLRRPHVPMPRQAVRDKTLDQQSLFQPLGQRIVCALRLEVAPRPPLCPAEQRKKTRHGFSRGFPLEIRQLFSLRRGGGVVSQAVPDFRNERG